MTDAPEIRLIPINQITVLNPRARNKRQHREIVNNIEESVTEERRSEGNPGNADDRAATEPVVSEDQAPE